MTRKYRVVYTQHVKKQLSKMDRPSSERIYSWIGKKLVDTEDPYSPGRKLTGSLDGMIRYRVGDYRIIAEIREGELIILVIEIEHRRKVYEQF